MIPFESGVVLLPESLIVPSSRGHRPKRILEGAADSIECASEKEMLGKKKKENLWDNRHRVDSPQSHSDTLLGHSLHRGDNSERCRACLEEHRGRPYTEWVCLSRSLLSSHKLTNGDGRTRLRKTSRRLENADVVGTSTFEILEGNSSKPRFDLAESLAFTEAIERTSLRIETKSEVALLLSTSRCTEATAQTIG